MDDTEARLTRCFAIVFPKVDARQLRDANTNSVAGWDSIATVTLINVIEEEFGEEVPLENAEELISFTAFLAYLEKRKAACSMITKARKTAELVRFVAEQGVRALCHQPNRASEVYRAVWYADPVRLPQKSMQDLCSGIENAEVSLVSPLLETGGNVWLNELVVLAAICRWLQPREIFEIGTFNGRTTVNLAGNSPQDCIVHTLDIPHDHPSLPQVSGEEQFRLKQSAGACYRKSDYRGKVRQLWADSAEFDPRPFAGRIDLAFVDGSHSYEYIRNDTEKIMHMMAPGGIILWHDYYPQYPDVARYLEERPEGRFHIETTSLVIHRLPSSEQVRA